MPIYHSNNNHCYTPSSHFSHTYVYSEHGDNTIFPHTITNSPQNLTTTLLRDIIKLTNNSVTHISVWKAFHIGVFPYNTCQEIKLWIKAYEYLRLFFL